MLNLLYALSPAPMMRRPNGHVARYPRMGGCRRSVRPSSRTSSRSAIVFLCDSKTGYEVIYFSVLGGVHLEDKLHASRRDRAINNHHNHKPRMRVFAALASLVALATAAPCRQAWVVIPRGGGSEYGSELEVVKSSVLEKASESVSAIHHFSM
jgi:hypothetical protein